MPLTDEELVQKMKEAGLPVPPSLAGSVSPQGSKPSSREISADLDKTGPMLEHFLTHNMPAAAAGGVGGFLTGGPIGALSGAGSGLMSPPENLGDVLTFGASIAAQPVLGATSKIANPALRMLSRMGIGAGTEAVRGLAKFGDPEENGPTATSMIGAGALPALGGAVLDKATKVRNNQMIQGNVQKLLDEIHGTPQQLGPDNLPTGVTPELKAVHSDIQHQIEQSRQNAAQQIIVGKALAKEQAKVDSIKMQIDGPKDPEKVLKATYKRNQLAKIAVESDPYSPTTNYIKQLNASITDVKTSMRPSDTEADTIRKNTQIDAFKQQIQQVKDRAIYQRVQELRKASEDHLAQLYTDGSKRVQEQQDILDGLQKEIDTTPLENQRLMTLMGRDPKKPSTPEAFFGNLLKDNADDVKAVFYHLDSLPNGNAQINTVRKGLINEFIAKAYDPKTGLLTNANDLFKGEGPFNKDKVEAMFGGRDGGRQFVQIIDDVRRLTETNTAPQGVSNLTDKAIKHASFITPTGFLLHSAGIPYGAAFGMAAGADTLGTFTVLAWPKLITATVENPKLAEAFHKFAVSGGTAPMSQTLVNWIKDNGPKL